MFFGISLGLRTAKSFQLRTAPMGGARGRRRKKIPLFLTNFFFETATKNKNVNVCFDFCWAKKKLSVEARKFLYVPRPLQKPVNRDFLKNLR